jgi:ankyrin repeat protein
MIRINELILLKSEMNDLDFVQKKIKICAILALALKIFAKQKLDNHSVEKRVFSAVEKRAFSAYGSCLFARCIQLSQFYSSKKIENLINIQCMNHDRLIDLFNILYPNNKKEGLCNWYALKGVSYILQEEPSSFLDNLRRLDTLMQQHSDSALLTAEVKKEPELGRFLQEAHDADTGLKIVSSENYLGALSGFYQKPADLLRYFLDLHKKVLSSDPSAALAFKITSRNHAVTFGYKPHENAYFFIDANDLGETSSITDSVFARINQAYSFSLSRSKAFSIEAFSSSSKVQTIFDAFKHSIFLKQTSRLSTLTEKQKANWLFEAASSNDKESVQALIEAKVDVDLADENEVSPLLIASQNGHTEIVQMLIDGKAKVDLAEKDGASPLYIACQNGHTEIVQMLIKAGADVDLVNKNGCPSLFVASQRGHTKTVEQLIKAKANVNLANKNGFAPLYIACQNGHTEIVQMLIEAKADVNSFDKNGSSSLLTASYNSHTEIVQMLIKAKADVNLANKNGLTPLIIASLNGHAEIVQMLIDAKADVNLASKNRSSPLLTASQKGHVEIVQKLIDAKADVNVVNKNRLSPLLMACQNGHTEIVQKLIEAKADVNLAEKDGFSPLFMACQNGHVEIVQKLIDAKADVNLVNKNGVAPLYIANQNGHTEIVQMLIRRLTEGKS